MSETEQATQDPFLPPLLPTDNPAAEKKAAKRSLVTWVVLVVVFLVTYWLLRSPGSAHAPHAASLAHEACETNLWVSFGPAGVLLAVFGLWIWRLRRGQGHQPEQEEAMLAHLDGEHARARQHWLALADKQRGNAGYARISLFNAASSAIALGDFDHARDELLALERSAGFLFIDGHRLLASSWLARVFVLRGELDRARAWLRSTRQRLERYRHDRSSHGVVLRLTECFLLAREGKYDDALQLLQARWRRQLVEHEPGATLLLRAYLVARTSPPRESSAAAPWIAALRTAGFEVAYLWTEWPELEAFAVDNGLASRLPSAAHA
jgi:hypothetical protein